MSKKSKIKSAAIEFPGKGPIHVNLEDLHPIVCPLEDYDSQVLRDLVIEVLGELEDRGIDGKADEFANDLQTYNFWEPEPEPEKLIFDGKYDGTSATIQFAKVDPKLIELMTGVKDAVFTPWEKVTLDPGGEAAHAECIKVEATAKRPTVTSRLDLIRDNLTAARNEIDRLFEELGL